MRQQRHEEALVAVENSDYHGLIIACVGFGKTILAQRILKSYYDRGHRGKVLYQTSTTNLIDAFKEEQKLCKELYGFEITTLLDIDFACYQSKALTDDYDITICDEIDATGQILFEPINQFNGKIIGMSGTLSTAGELSKADMITAKVPIVYNYTMEQGIEDSILTNYQTVIIHHQLTGKPYKNVFKNGPVLGEAMFYAKCVEMTNKFRFSHPHLLKRYGLMATILLQNLPSKIPIVKDLLTKLKGQRGLVFGKTNEYVSNFCAVNEEDKFNNHEIDVVGSSKKLTRGFTPKDVDFLIILSPISTITELEQILGRMVRLGKEDKLPTIYIIVTDGTYEENWLRRGTIAKKGSKITRFLDLNIIRHERTAL
jgi:superfamily II DNA or RNA helicase